MLGHDDCHPVNAGSSRSRERDAEKAASLLCTTYMEKTDGSPEAMSSLNNLKGAFFATTELIGTLLRDMVINLRQNLRNVWQTRKLNALVPDDFDLAVKTFAPQMVTREP